MYFVTIRHGAEVVFREVGATCVCRMGNEQGQELKGFAGGKYESILRLDSQLSENASTITVDVPEAQLKLGENT